MVNYSCSTAASIVASAIALLGVTSQF